MKEEPRFSREHWSSRLTFVLASAGSAVGLGNIWKFPYITGNNGGGMFVLVYLACIVCVAVPLLVCEMLIGARGQANAVQAFENIHGPRSPWRFLGMLALLGVFLILSFYSVVGGWVLEFLTLATTGRFVHTDPQAVGGMLEKSWADPARQVAWLFAFITLNAVVIAGGFKRGLERANAVLMPALVIILLLLLVHAALLPGIGAALAFLFWPDASRLTAGGVLDALGHSFFTLNIAAAVHITYSSHLTDTKSLGRSALAIALFDTVIALLAGIVIFAIAFSFGMETGVGPTLIFRTLPVLFANMTLGWLVSVLFFLLVAFAALTSSLSMFEALVCHATETCAMGRKTATLTVAAAAFPLGIASALSTNVLSEWTLRGKTAFALLDWVTTNLFLPAGGVGMALFVGWVMGPKAVVLILGERLGQSLWGRAFLWLLRLPAPAAVCAVWIRGLMG
ncbi:MAG: sodium-dependent transporter [Myxococcota bacterium]